MEGLKQVAVKLYNDSSEAEKEKIDEIFRVIDSDGDGKVTLQELNDSGLFTSELSSIFDQFVTNGVVDFDGFLIFFLHTFGPVIQLLGKYETGPRMCDGCRRNQKVPDFSCFFCLEKFPNTYDLCYDCHERGVHSNHKHDEDSFMLNHESLALLDFFRHGLISNQEYSKATPTIHVPEDTKIIDGDLLQIDPPQLQFPIVLLAPNVILGKRSSCSLRVTNKSSYHVTILVTGICCHRFSIKPNNKQDLLPHSTKLLSVYMHPSLKVPLEKECGEKFFIHSKVVSSEFTKEDIAAKMIPRNWIKEYEWKSFYVYVPPPTNEIKEDSATKMSSSDLLHIEPRELRLPFVVGKRSSCPIRLTNKSDNHVGVWVNLTNIHGYTVTPNEYVMSPHSTMSISVGMRPPKKALRNMNCWDRFYIFSVRVPPGFPKENLTAEMFKMKPGNGVEECVLRAFYVYVPHSNDEPMESSSSLLLCSRVTRILRFALESMASRTIFVPTDISARITGKMMTGNLLHIEPLQLQFPFMLAPRVVLGKRSTFCLRLTNKLDHPVAYWVKRTKPGPNFYLQPKGIQVILPHSTLLLSVEVDPPRSNVSPERGYTFLIHSIIVSTGTTKKYMTENTFGMQSGNWLERCDLRAVHVNIPPQLEEAGSIKMSRTADLHIEPRELRLPFVVGKTSSCPIWLTNNSDDHVGIWVNHTNLPIYDVFPNEDVMLPRSTMFISVDMKPPKQVPEEMLCKDEVYIFSRTVRPGFTKDNLTAEMFKMGPGNGVKECVLKIVYVYLPPLDAGPMESSSIHASANEFKVKRTIYVPPDISAGLNVEMITGNLLQIEPLELQFPFILSAPNVVLGKRSSCSLQLTNKYDYHVAFQLNLETGDSSKYAFHPHEGVMLPYSTANVTIKMEQPEEVPLDAECTDTFRIYSVAVPSGLTEKDITRNTFSTKSGNWIEKCVLKAVYVRTQKEGTGEEDSSGIASMISNDVANQTSETNLISKSLTELII